MTRSRDIADQQDNLGGAVAPFVAGKNGIINGGFDIWQRGTSIANDATYTKYCADRFQINRAGLATGVTVSRQSSSLTGIQYAARVQRDSGNTNTGAIYFLTALETADSYKFAGQAVTISFYARAGANYSSASSALSVRLDYGTGTDQSMGTGFTGQTAVVNQTATLTTSWQRFTYSATVSATATEIGFYTFNTPVGTAGANDYYEITGVQLEIGSAATPFARAGGSIGGELALCQRYYETSYDIGTAAATATATGSYGFCVGTNSAAATYFTYAPSYKVTKRGTPTITLYDLVGNAGKVTKVSAVDLSLTDNQTGTADRIGQSEFRIYSALGTAGGFYGHFVASAEL
jgi:hypothetical protein